MKKKGFTLIELLAVIVILAIIALIATPIVMNVIENARKGATERSAENYLKAVETAVMQKKLDLGHDFNPSECVLISNNKLSCDGVEVDISMNGNMPDIGSVVKFSDAKVDLATLYYEGQLVVSGGEGEMAVGDSGTVSDVHNALSESKIKNVYGEDIKIGQTVNYNEGTTGKDVNWKVLGIENGKILLVSSENIYTGKVSAANKQIVSIDGGKLENGVIVSEGGTEQEWLDAINEPCYAYDEGEYVVKGSARSLNVTDINKITGFNPYSIAKYNGAYHKGRRTQYGNEVTYTYGTDASGNRTLIANSLVYATNPGDLNTSEIYKNTKTFEMLDGTILGTEDNEQQKIKSSIKIKSTYYWYNPVVLSSIDPNDPGDAEDYANAPKTGLKEDSLEYKMLFEDEDGNKESYWLADTYYFTNFASGKAQVWYGLRSVENGNVGMGSNSWFLTLHPSPNSGRIHSDGYSKGVRAVVTLDSDVKLTWDSTTSSWDLSPSES